MIESEKCGWIDLDVLEISTSCGTFHMLSEFGKHCKNIKTTVMSRSLRLQKNYKDG